jgi:hypothetical protein
MHATQKSPAALPGSPAQILRDTADYLQAHGWIQGDHYEDLAIDAPPADLVGAMLWVCFGYPNAEIIQNLDPTNPLNDLDGALVAYANAAEVLADFIGVEEMVDANGDPVPYSLTAWNDEEYQSIGCVTAVLRAAADDYERTGGAA